MNEKPCFFGALSAHEEFFYPDTDLCELPDHLRVVLPENGRPGVQLLLKTDVPSLPLSLESDAFTAEWFRMKAIPVEYNTGDGEEQGGAMVLENRPVQKPAYATRLAPFTVYDCLEPISGALVPENGLAALYFCLVPKAGLSAGTHAARLHVGEYVCDITAQVYGVAIPENTFPVTNWFSLDSISLFHHVQQGTPEFYDMVRQYARAMHRVHQTQFYLELNDQCVVSRDPYEFNFDYLESLIRCFFDEGLTTIETGPLLSRGYLPDGMPDMYTSRFSCIMAPDVYLDTPEGYAITVKYVQALSAFFKAHGWEKNVVFHIHDEPDVHCPPEALEPRKQQYYLAASILRKYLPGVKIIEAVSSAEFRGGVDIWVPGTPGYEQHKDDFDRLIGLGEEVWTYVCCSPEGHWLNRFLDFAVFKGRLLFWGCAKNRISGFLHWGFNQFQNGMNPFLSTSCPNHTGIGTNFPCGDSFIVYPGPEGPWLGMRLEASRRGAEDAALLRLLREKDETAHDALIARVFRSNSDYNDDPTLFEDVYESLLKQLSN